MSQATENKSIPYPQKLRNPVDERSLQVPEKDGVVIPSQPAPQKVAPSGKLLFLPDRVPEGSGTTAKVERMPEPPTVVVPETSITSIATGTYVRNRTPDRALSVQRELLAAEGGFSLHSQAAQILKITDEQLETMRRQGDVIGVLTQKGYVYPNWQFEKGMLLKGLRDILELLRGYDAWMKVAFMLSRNTCLEGEKPLIGLRQGHLEQVKRAARVYGEQGAV